MRFIAAIFRDDSFLPNGRNEMLLYRKMGIRRIVIDSVPNLASNNLNEKQHNYSSSSQEPFAQPRARQ